MSTRGAVGIPFEVLTEEPEGVFLRVAGMGFFAPEDFAVVEADALDFTRIGLPRIGCEAVPTTRAIPVGVLGFRRGMLSHRPSLRGGCGTPRPCRGTGLQGGPACPWPQLLAEVRGGS